jgi:hypothetical protein
MGGEGNHLLPVRYTQKYSTKLYVTGLIDAAAEFPRHGVDQPIGQPGRSPWHLARRLVGLAIVVMRDMSGG